MSLSILAIGRGRRAGGGAPIVHPNIQEKWPHAHMADKPRLAVAEGMRRFGMALLRARQLQGVSA